MPPNQQFRLRQKLLRVMKIVGATEKLFTTEQILSYLAKYIEQKNLCDSRNMCMVHCKGDLLEDIFGVQVFSNSNLKDVWQFIFPHMIPATSKEVQEHETECRNKQEILQCQSDATSSGKSDFQWMSQLPWWYFVEKNQKDDNRDIATASGSNLGNSTVYVVDTDYDSDSSISSRAEKHLTDLMNQFREQHVFVTPATSDIDDDHFSLEYEPDSESSDSDKTEPVDSEDEPYIPTPLPRITDCEDTSTTDNTDLSNGMDLDIPLDDHWRCLECRTVNPPTVGYCQRCWMYRKGWLPESVLPSSGITKSLTLPAGQYAESFTPALVRSYTQPNPANRGIDVADGRMRKNKGESTESHFPDNESSCNFDELPFNNKRKLSSPEPTSSPPISKPKTSVSDPTLMHDEASNSKITITSKSSSLPSSKSSSESTMRENCSSGSNTQLKCYMTFPGLCNICHNNPNNAILVHGTTSHQYCCYRCAKMLQKRGKTCPVCRQPIALVVKNYICHM